MDDLLLSMLGCKLPSASGRVIYSVSSVELGQRVVLVSSGRRKPSSLPWNDIERVYCAARAGQAITPTSVDEILENPNNYDSSTMCALVLAMKDPKRIKRA